MKMNTQLTADLQSDSSSLLCHKFPNEKSEHIFVGDWAQNFSIFQATNDKLSLLVSEELNFVCLDIFAHQTPSDNVYLAGSDSSVYSFNLEKQNCIPLFSQKNLPNFKIFSPSNNKNLLFSLSLDGVLSVWDTRNPKNSIDSYEKFDGKPYAASFEFPYLVVATNNNEISFFDIENYKKGFVPSSRDSFEAEHPVRCLAIEPQYCEYLALGTLGGEFKVWNSQDQKGISKVASKIGPKSSYKEYPKMKPKNCKNDGKVVTYYPINDIKFHPSTQGVLFIAGGDGQVIMYDGVERKFENVTYLNQPTTATAVTHLDAFKSKDWLAICVGDDYVSSTSKKIESKLIVCDISKYLPESENEDDE